MLETSAFLAKASRVRITMGWKMSPLINGSTIAGTSLHHRRKNLKMKGSPGSSAGILMRHCMVTNRRGLHACGLPSSLTDRISRLNGLTGLVLLWKHHRAWLPSLALHSYMRCWPRRRSSLLTIAGWSMRRIHSNGLNGVRAGTLVLVLRVVGS